MASTRLMDEIGVLMQHPVAFYDEVIRRSGENFMSALFMKLRPLFFDVGRSQGEGLVMDAISYPDSAVVCTVFAVCCCGP